MKKWIESNDWRSLILFENREIIVANKPAGVPSQDDKTGDTSLKKFLEEKLKRRLFIINRLDRPVSGCALFAKSGKAQTKYAATQKVEKEYIAIVSKIEIKNHDILTHYLRKNGGQRKSIYRDIETKGFKKAQLEYWTVEVLDNYLVLKIRLLTGRFHQIRAQLSAIGCPIKGDVKYGARRGNKDRSIDLHAASIRIDNQIIVAPPLGRNNSLLGSKHISSEAQFFEEE